MNTLIRKYRNRDLYSLNCSEAIVYAANEYYDLGLSDNGLKWHLVLVEASLKNIFAGL